MFKLKKWTFLIAVFCTSLFAIFSTLLLPAYKRTLIKMKCQYCGKIFFSDNQQRKYCCNSHKSLAYQQRKKGEESTNLFGDPEVDSEENFNSDNFLNDEDMTTLVEEIQKNADLNLKLRLLEKDFESLKHENSSLKEEISELESMEEDVEKLQGLHQKCQDLEAENQDLKEQLEEITDQRNTAGSNLDYTEEENKKLKLAILIYRHIHRGTVPSFKSVKEIYAEHVDLNKADSFKVDDYRLVREAGSETYRLIK